MLGFGKEYNYSFINEIMLFDRNIILEMINTKYKTIYDFIENSNKIINNECYISEFELYGNYITKFHNCLYNYKYLKTLLNGKYGEWSDIEIENYIKEQKNTDYDIISMHSWIKNQ